MLRDAATLLAHKLIFSEEAKTTEIRKKKITYSKGVDLIKSGGDGKQVVPTEIDMNRIIY